MEEKDEGQYEDGGQAEPVEERKPVINDEIKDYFRAFYTSLRQGNPFKLVQLYDQQFHYFTNRYYKTSRWPSAENVAPLVENDEVFLALYQELYFRHIYSRQLDVSLVDRIASFRNYTKLFKILTRPNPPPVPAPWLWEMIDEFVYHFESFSHFKERRLADEADFQVLRDNLEVWSAPCVLRELRQLVDHSKIRTDATYPNFGDEKVSKADALYRSLGYFALVGWLRVECILGDYQSALDLMPPIDLSKRHSLFYDYFACHISLFYYLGFSFLMLRRYPDAIDAFALALQHVSRTSFRYVGRGTQYDTVLKTIDRMSFLLAIAYALSPAPLDHSLLNQLKEKLGEKWHELQRGDEKTFMDLYSQSAPKFVCPAMPNCERLPAAVDPVDAQRELFHAEVTDSLRVSGLLGLLRLYRSLNLSKLAKVHSSSTSSNSSSGAEKKSGEEPNKTVYQLLAARHRMRNLRWRGMSPAQAQWESSGDVSFYLDKDVIFVNDTREKPRIAEYYLNNIARCNELLDDLSKIPTQQKQENYQS